MIKGIWLVLRPNDRGIPVESVFHILSAHSKVLNGCGHDIGRALSLHIQNLDRSLITSSQDISRIIRIEGQEGRFSTCGVVPMLFTDSSTTQSHAGNHNGSIVLLSSIDSVWKLIIGVDPIKLSGRHIVLRGPGLASVEGDRTSSIICQNHVFGVFGIDPEIMIIPMGSVNCLKAFPSVEGLQHRGTLHPNGVFIIRICKNFDVIPSPLRKSIVLVD